MSDLSRCPACGGSCAGQTAVDGSGDDPVAGDYGLCDRCASLHVFTGVGSEKRDPTVEELAIFVADPYAMEFVGVMLLVVAERAAARRDKRVKSRLN